MGQSGIGYMLEYWDKDKLIWITDGIIEKLWLKEDGDIPITIKPSISMSHAFFDRAILFRDYPRIILVYKLPKVEEDD
jgi:hypothetical protein